MGHSPRGHKESDMTQWLTFSLVFRLISGWGNRDPLLLTYKSGCGTSLLFISLHSLLYHIHNLCLIVTEPNLGPLACMQKSRSPDIRLRVKESAVFTCTDFMNQNSYLDEDICYTRRHLLNSHPRSCHRLTASQELISNACVALGISLGCPGSLHPSSRWICSRTLSNDHRPWKALSSLHAALCMTLLDFILTTAVGCEYQLDYPHFNYLGPHS